MRTTLDVEKELLEAVMTLTYEKSLSKAVTKALEDYVRRRRVEELIALAGTFEVADDWREREGREVEEMKRLQW